MQLKQFNLFFLILGLNIFLQNSILASIAEGTLVKTSQGLTSIENLKIGDKILVPNFNTLICKDNLEKENQLIEVAITNIVTRTTEKVILIKSNKGDIQTDENQLFYEFQNKGFIKAKDIKPGSLFITITENIFEFCQCLEIETLNYPTLLYDLTIEEPHVFFASKAQILIHNFTDPISIGIEITFGETIASIAWTGIAISAGWFGIKIGKKISKHQKKEVAKTKAMLDEITKKNNPTPPPKDPKLGWEVTIPVLADKVEKEAETVGDKLIRLAEGNDLRHIFRDAPGHIKFDTPENRALLESMVNNKANFLVKDAHGNEWFAKITNDGKQLWAGVRDNVIRYGGINENPKECNPITGLCKQLKSK